MVRTKIKRSIERRPALGLSLLSGAAPAQVFDAERSEWVRTVKAKFNASRFCGALEMFGRALCFHHFKRKWPASVKAFPHFALFESAAPLGANRAYREVLRIADSGFRSAASHGENQEAFFYQVHADEDLTNVLIRATFYGRAVVTLAFTPRPMGPD